MGKPSAPSAPNPVDTARASMSTGVGTSIANAFLNNTNQITPDGALNYEVTGSHQWKDPYTGLDLDIPTFTATQTLSPQQMAIKAQTQAASFNMAGLANAKSERLASAMNSGIAPTAGNTFDMRAAADNVYGANDFSLDRNRVEDALFARLNPQLSRERTGIEQRLADQGIKYGSPAYTAAMDDYNRGATDLRLGVTEKGGQEQMRLANMANTAQAIKMGNAQGIFNAQNTSRNNYMNEQQGMINEISALMSGGQINNPSFVNTPNNQIPTTDVAGLINSRFSQDMDIYKQESANHNQLMGGLFGMAGGMMKMSDERVKDVGPKLATIFAAGDDGERQELPIYAYSYKGDPEQQQHVGPMAQDVEKIDKRAVKKDARGIRHIDTRRVMGSILKAA